MKVDRKNLTVKCKAKRKEESTRMRNRSMRRGG